MLLVGTGATLTNRSIKMFDNMHGANAIELKQGTQKIVEAVGTTLQV